MDTRILVIDESNSKKSFNLKQHIKFKLIQMKNSFLGFLFFFIIVSANAEVNLPKVGLQHVEKIVLILKNDNSTIEYRFHDFEKLTTFIQDEFSQYKQEEWWLTIKAERCVESGDENSCVSVEMSDNSSKIDTLMKDTRTALEKLN